jgi:NAD-dependent deacetylase
MAKRVIELLENSKNCLVFTGAGVSTLSGIRDFRGVGGFYTSDYQGYRVEDLLSLNLFYANPKLFYDWAREFIYGLESFKPSIVHTTLAKLEKKGIVKGVYTQNIDLLHQNGGSEKVYEIHGSPANNRCISCKTSVTYAEIAPIVMDGKIPTCKNCGSVIKPDIIFYGESLNSSLLDKAYSDFAKADLVLALGSSLTVQPAASLPMAAVNNGGVLVIVNAQETPLDEFATLLYTDLKELFTEIDSYFTKN